MELWSCSLYSFKVSGTMLRTCSILNAIHSPQSTVSGREGPSVVLTLRVEQLRFLAWQLGGDQWQKAAL